MLFNRLSKRVQWVLSLVTALAIVVTGIAPAEATHLRGAVGYIKYDPVAKTVTVNSTMVERKDACLNGSSAYTSNLSSASGSTMPSASLCTFFGFPTITSIDPTTGATANITKCVNQATTPTSWSFDVTSEPLYNIFNTVYVINVNCPSFSTSLDYVFSQTGSNRIGGIRNTTNQVIQFEGRVKLSGGVAHTTPIYNTGYMTNVPFAAAGDNTIFKTNLNALDENGRSVTYALVTSSAAANGGYGATRIPCSNLNTTTGEFQLGRPLCLAGENYDTSFSGGTSTTRVYWALKTKATTNDGNFISANPEVGTDLYWVEKAMTMGGGLPVDPTSANGFNNPRLLATELAGANGVTNAHGLAKIYSAAVVKTDGLRLLNDDAIEAACIPASFGENHWHEPAPHPIWGNGFMVPGAVHIKMPGNKGFGHDGLGGQAGWGSLEHRIGFGYTTTFLKRTPDTQKNQQDLVASVNRALGI